MALSGSFGKTVNTRLRLQVDWTASQNVSGNYSDVTARLYWIGLDQYSAVYASAADPVSITIDGDTSSAATATPALKAYQKKLIRTHTHRVYHTSNGSKTFTLSAYFDVNIDFNGWIGRVSISDSITLNTIPRESSLASSPSWEAGKQKTVSVSRYSTSFHHVVKVYVANRSGSWVFIKDVDLSKSQTSVSSDFSEANHENIYNQLDGRSSAGSRMVVHTYSGSTLIGTSTHDGTVTAETASFLEIPASFNIGSAFRAEAKYYNGIHNHTIRLKNGSTVLKSYTNITSDNTPGVDAWVDFDTASIAATLYGLTPNSNSLTLTMEVDTFYGAEQVRTTRSDTIVAKVTNSDPTFAAAPTYADINTTATAITGNNQHIIANISNVRATLTAANRALPVNAATMKEYVATLGGKSITRPWSASASVVFDFGTINAKTNQSLVVRAVDSRGNSRIVSRTVIIIPYDPPGISFSAARINGFEEDTVLKLSGTLASLKVNNVDKNYLVSARYRTKLSTSTAWGAYSSFTTSGFPTFTATDLTILLDRINSFDVQVEVKDRLGTTTLTRTVASGKPIIFIDEYLKSVGFGDFPDEPNQILITNQMKFAAGRFGAGGAYSIDFSKGNVFGMNAIFFHDTTTGNEGINFPKTGRPNNSKLFDDYDALNMRDEELYINGVTAALKGKHTLWSGAAYPNTSTTIVPTRRLDQCPHGWCLIWSEYVVGSGEVNAGWQFTFVPKDFADMPGSGVKLFFLWAGDIQAVKYIYITNTQITAAAQSSSGNNRLIVLRSIVAV